MKEMVLELITKENHIDEPFTVNEMYALQIHTVRADEVVVVASDEALVAYVSFPRAFASLIPRTEIRIVATRARPSNTPI